MTPDARSTSSRPPIRSRRLLGFAVGNVGAATFSTVPGLLLLIYMTDTLGIGAAAAGLVVVLPKAWDVVLAPIVGTRSDREAGRTGHRTRLMLIGSLTLPVLFAAMFASPFTGTGGLLWVLAAFVLAATAFSFFQVPYVTLPTDMSPDPQERTRVMGWRIVAVTIGILVGGALAPVLIDLGGGGRSGHLVMGVAMGVVVAVTTLVCIASTRWIRAEHSAVHSTGLRESLRVARGNRAFLILTGSYLLQALGIGMIQSSIAYVSTYRLGNTGLTALLFVGFVAPSIVAVPLWTRLARRIGKSRTLMLATTVFGGCCAALLPAVLAASIPAVLALVVVMGIGFAGEQVMVFAMLPDTIVADIERTGSSHAGVFTGVLTSMETGALAVGPGIFALILAATGFASSTFDHPVPQSDSALTGIAVGFTVVPAVLILVTLPLIRLYSRTPAAAVGDTRLDLITDVALVDGA